MQTINFIHIGDIHFPDNYNKHIVDHKDKGLETTFIESISPSPFQKVSRKLTEILKKCEVRAVLFSGDLTSRGNVPGYDACVDFFVKLLAIDDADNRVQFHVVPGNHDIDRNEAFFGDSKKMFDDFTQIWKHRGLDVMEPNAVRVGVIDEANCKAQFISLNTCIGCGQTRQYPEFISKVIDSTIEGMDLTNKEKFELFCEKLDTPAASQDDLMRVEEVINENKECNGVPVILAHHGLLPQSTIRTDIYTEIINGGHIRRLLNTIQYPVIYCHGHIHQDPIEVVTQPKYARSSLISISAPEYPSGFNLVELHFGANGIPLGCNVRPYRTSDYCSVEEGNNVRVKFNIYDNIDDYCDDDLKKVYKLIPAEEIRFNDLFKEINVTDWIIDELGLVNILEQLEWLGVLTIDNQKRKSTAWIIRRIGL